MAVLAGRFTLVNRTKDTVTVGLIGNVTRDTLTKENIEYLCEWYGAKDWDYTLVDEREEKPDDLFISRCNFYIEFTRPNPEHNLWFVIGTEKRTGKSYLLESCMLERDAESFCESWGWSYDDGKKSYWLRMERMDHSESRQMALDIAKAIRLEGKS